MNRFLKWVGVIFGMLVGLLVLLFAAVYFKPEKRPTHSRIPLHLAGELFHEYPSDGSVHALGPYTLMDDHERKCAWVYLRRSPTG